MLNKLGLGLQSSKMFISGANIFKDAISYYKLNKTSGAVIDSNSGFDGTAENGVVRGVQGIKGNAFEFDGIDDYVALPDTYDFVQNTNVFTINMWVKILDLDGRNGLMGNALSTSEKGFLILFDTVSASSINITKGLTFRSFKGVPGQTVLFLSSQNNVITDNDYHMVTVVGLGSTGKIYLDGVDLPLSQNNFTSLSTGTGLDAMSIGCAKQNILFSNAVIDEVSVFDVSKTQEEITEIYNFYT